MNSRKSFRQQDNKIPSSQSQRGGTQSSMGQKQPQFSNDENFANAFGNPVLPPITQSRQSYQQTQNYQSIGLQNTNAMSIRGDNFNNEDQQRFNLPSSHSYASLPQNNNMGINIDLQQKVRELELSIIDIKAQSERKLHQIMEELPSKIDREMKRIEMKEQTVMRNNQAQITMTSEQVNIIKENLLFQLEQLGDKYVVNKTKVEEQEYKLNNLQRNFDSLKNNINFAQISGGGGTGGGAEYDSANNILNIAELETEVRLQREQLADEKLKREQTFFDQHQMFVQLQNQLHLQENELIKRMKEHREDQFSLLQANTDEKTLVERMKQERTDHDLSFVKGMITTLDKKIDDEASNRLRSEDDIRKWFDQKISMINERLSLEERGSLDRERRMMQQLQEGLQTVGEIVRGVKEQSSIGLNEVHTLAMDNIQEVSRKIDIIREQFSQRQQNIEIASNDIKGQMEQLSEQTFKHAKTVNESLAKEINRMERICSTLERHTSEQIIDMKALVHNNDEKIEKWKVNLEDTEGKKLLEIHSAMKILNNNFQTTSQDSKERFEMLQKQFVAFDNSIKMQISDIRYKIELDIKTVEERALMLLEKAYIKQTAGVDEGQTSKFSLFGQGIGDPEQKILQLKEEMKLYIDRTTIQQIQKVIEQKHYSELLLEGRANAFTVELEKKMKEVIRSFKNEIEIQESEARVRERDWADKMQEDITRIKHDTQRNTKNLEDRDLETKKYVDKALKQTTDETKLAIDKKMMENEVQIRKLLLKNGGSGSDGLKNDELRSMRDKNLLDYVETNIKNLKNEITHEFEEDKSRNSQRLDQITNLIHTHKGLLDEHITQIGGSLKALLKANLNAETAERHKDLERISITTDQRCAAAEKYVNSRIGEEYGRLVLRIDLNRDDFVHYREQTELKLKDYKEQIALITTKLDDLFKNLDERLSEIDKKAKEQKDKEEREKAAKEIMNKLLDQIAGQAELSKNQTLNERLEQIEVKEVLNDMINKVSQVQIEQSLFGLVDTIQSVVGNVNQTSSHQYEEFNKALKDSLGLNLQQLQDTLANVSEEVLNAKNKLTELTNKVEDIDINNRKGLAELSDRVEIERCLNDLVSWVAALP